MSNIQVEDNIKFAEGGTIKDLSENYLKKLADEVSGNLWIKGDKKRIYVKGGNNYHYNGKWYYDFHENGEWDAKVYLEEGYYNKNREEYVDKHINSMIEDMKEAIEYVNKELEEIVKKENEIKKQKENPEYIITNSNYFKRNPEKILAEVITEKNGKPITDRFGKPIKQYKGTIDNLNRINVKDAEIVTEYKTPETNIDKPEAEAIKKPDNKISEANKKAKDNIVKKLAEKNSKLSEKDINAIIPAIEILNERENYNEGLSDNEIKAYIWYMRREGIKMEGVWREFFDENAYSDDEINALIDVWMKEGCIFYHKGEFVYSAFYFQGDIYEKKNEIDNESVKAHIIEIYGKDVYQKQYDAVTSFYNDVRKRALRIGNPQENKKGIVEQQDELVLDIVPTSEFSRNTYIEHLSDLKPFPGHVAATELKAEKEGWVSLTTAFKYWLRTYKNIYYKKNTNSYQIINLYLNKGRASSSDSKTEQNAKKARAKSEGKRLFTVFLQTMLTQEDKYRIEFEYNRKYNNYVSIDYDKIPIAYPVAKKYPGNEDMDIRFEKREAVAFMQAEGSGILAYDVGFGKTWAAIMAMSQAIESGQAKRPLMVVPNQTYSQWMSETKGILPHIKINGLYNLSEDYIELLKDENGDYTLLPENSISIMTIQGLEKLGLSESESYKVADRLFNMFVQDSLFFSNRDIDKGKKDQNDIVKMQERINTYLAKGNRGTEVDINELGIDWLGMDEAHAYKNVFSSVKSSDQSETSYEIKGKGATTRAIKGFILAHYIQSKNKERNVMLLTATPVTSSPVEVYSMLSFVGYDKLKKGITFNPGGASENLSNLVRFFDHFVKEETEIVINAALQAQRKPVFKGWRNLKILQQVLFRVINFKNMETKDKKNRQPNIIRPNKYLLPYNGRYENGKFIPATKAEEVDITLQMSPLQEMITSFIKEYATGKIGYDGLKKVIKDALPENLIRKDTKIIKFTNEEKEDIATSSDTEVNEDLVERKEKKGIALIRSVNLARSVGVSPFLLKIESDTEINKKTGRGKLVYMLRDPDYKEYVETSNKIFVAVKSVKMVKDYFESIKKPVPGQIIYIDRGKEYLTLIKEYLINEMGFANHEIGIISSGLTSDKKRSIQNLFNGIKEDKKTGMKVMIPDEKRIKIIIGTSSIREGMDLQMHTLFLYDLFIGWNPTDRIQLEGRAWRQKNKFYNVFIVSPLLQNSMDAFMLQKLEEKTDRINTLWDRDGKTNVLGTEEYNPEELKYQLITDPAVIAEMEIDGETSELEEDKALLESEIRVAETMLTNFDAVEKYEPILRKIVDFWRPQKIKKDKEGNPVKPEPRKISTIIDLMNKIVASQTDSEGKPIADLDFIEDVGMQYGYAGYKVSLPSWFPTFKAAVAVIKRKSENNAFKSKESLYNYIETLKEKERRAAGKLESLKNGEAKNYKIEQVIKKQKELYVKPKTLDEIVEEIGKFSPKFTELRAGFPAENSEINKIENMPPMDAAGKRKIDNKSINLLEEELRKLTQTSVLHQVNGEYTEERKELHNKIINDYINRALCTEQNEKPIAVITGGIPGSGKTYFIKKYANFLASDKILLIDEDKIRAELPEYKGWNADQTNTEASGIVRQIISKIEHTKCKPDILFDGTMNKPKNYEYLMYELKQAGYDIYAVFVEIPENIAIKRTLERYAETGRYVPRNDIKLSVEQSFNVFQNLKSKVKGYIVVNGETAEIKEKQGYIIPVNRKYFNEIEFAKTKKFSDIAKDIKKILFNQGKVDYMKQGGVIDSLNGKKYKTLKSKLEDVIAYYKENKPIYNVTEEYLEKSSDPNIVEDFTFDKFDNDILKTGDVEDYDIIMINEYTPNDRFIEIADEIYDINFDNDDTPDDYSIKDLSEIIEDYILNDADIYDIYERSDCVAELDYRKEIEEYEKQKEQDYNSFIKETVEEFKDIYKNYIQEDEFAGYYGTSYYAYLLLDKNSNFIKNKPSKFYIERKDSESEYFTDNNTIQTRTFIKRNFIKENKDDAVIMVRISNHVQNTDNINDIVDAGISIAISRDFIYEHSQKGYEEQDKSKVSNSSAEQIDNFRGYFTEYKILYNGDNLEDNPIFEIKDFLNNISYSDIKN